MEIPDEIRKCVAFLCWRSNPDRAPEPHATAFFVAEDPPSAKHTVFCAVTAKHALDKVKSSECADAAPYLRINMRNERSKVVEVPLQHWSCDPDDSVDLAVACVQLPDNCDHKPFPVESRSIGGLSGSPVFVWLDQETLNRRSQVVQMVVWTPQEEDPPPYQKRAVFYLLGIMHGHWDLPASNFTIEDSMNRAMNMGIAIVVPAEKLRALLDGEHFRKHRDSLHLTEENLPHPD